MRPKLAAKYKVCVFLKGNMFLLGQTRLNIDNFSDKK